jgi:polyisoprenoid-binding protein YceI
VFSKKGKMKTATSTATKWNIDLAHSELLFKVKHLMIRKDFGLTWNAATETGGVLVSDEVKIHAEIQLVKQA